MRRLITVLFLLIPLVSQAKDPVHGEISETQDRKQQIWSSDSNQWMDIEAFWMEYAKRGGGLTWGRGSEYPEYSKVKERDTFMVELPQGVCLMEFFHERWRRANDVNRWNDKLNDYAGCPYVFD